MAENVRERPFEHWSLSSILHEMMSIAVKDLRIFCSGGPNSGNIITDDRSRYHALQCELDYREQSYMTRTEKLPYERM